MSRPPHHLNRAERQALDPEIQERARQIQVQAGREPLSWLNPDERPSRSDLVLARVALRQRRLPVETAREVVRKLFAIALTAGNDRKLFMAATEAIIAGEKSYPELRRDP
jgi:hypothetical protein